MSRHLTTIGLAMIVRDEPDQIERAIAQALPIVDHVTVLDTGSTDDTIQLARAALADVSHAIHTAEWKGFGPARTELLALARRRGCHYTLMLDADHTLHVNGDQPELTADAYTLGVKGTGQLEWRLPLLTRTQHPFEYRGAAHSYLASDVPYIEAPIDWLSIEGGAGATVEKLQRDRGLLETAFLENPDDARTVFYLARTHDDLGDWEKAISFYRVRATMVGWDQERYYARYRLGCLLSEHVSFAQGALELFNAWRETPSRIEALRALANAANAVADKAQMPTDALFVHPSAYKHEEAA